MEKQLPFPEQSKSSWADITRNEILFKWSEETRNQRYKSLIGQPPALDMTPEEIADGILDPETEKLRVLQKNLAEDKGETTEIYRRPN